MKKFNFKVIFSVLTLFLFIFSLSLMGQDSAITDPDIPDSWYEEPKTASEMGITEFEQSPILDNRVARGELPPVEERLPEDPPVAHPYKEIGEYGGTVNSWDRELFYYEAAYFNSQNASGGRPTPEGSKIVPNLLKGWEYSDDYKKLTIHLREGLKWSDGEEVTAEDYIYWWKYYANNQDLEPVSPEEWRPALLDVTREDKWTVTFTYGTPVPNEHIWFKNHMGANWSLAPAHFMKDFHPEFIGEEKVLAMAEEVGLERWDEYYSRIQDSSWQHPEYEVSRPVLNPYVAVERTETSVVLERNPYFPYVDPEGKQLPYIDKIRINLANSSEMASTKAATGDATFAARHPQTSDIPLFKRNQEKENYTTLIYRRAYGAEISLKPNLTHKDPQIRDIFQNDKFRKALSLAIDRGNINRKIYFGEAKPRQATVLEGSKHFKKEYAEAYADFEPERAATLLDEIGMIDTNNDGFRERPDGENFNPTLIYCKLGPFEPTAALEMIRSNWEQVGLDVDIKMVSRQLFNTRLGANNFDIGLWTQDRAIGKPFETLGFRWFTPVLWASYTGWPEWVNWYSSRGKEGMEPPEEIKEIIDAADVVLSTTDEEKRDKALATILESQAENLWQIGTVGLGPQPIIASNRLKNIPKSGYWDASIVYMAPFRPIQFYLEE